MLLGLRSLWESGVTPPTPPAPIVQSITQAFAPGGFAHGKPRKKPKTRYPGDEIEEEEMEELLALIGFDID